MPPIEYRISQEYIKYDFALEYMQNRVNKIYNNTSPEQIWLLEHEDIITAGTSANDKNELLNLDNLPVHHNTGRGGRYTYHGPGQLVIYFMINLKYRNMYIKEFISLLETIIIDILAHYSIEGYRKKEHIGVWVKDKNILGVVEKKIAALGVRVRKGISFHGVAININTDLKKYRNIIPCGISDFGVTSMHQFTAALQIENVKEVAISTLKHHLK